MNLVVVIFLYLVPDNWFTISEEIFESLVKSGLYEQSEKILVSLVSDKKQFSIFENTFMKKYGKLEIFEISEENTFEYLGIKAVYESSKNEDSLILYLHSKGVTSGNISYKNHKIRRYFLKHLVSDYRKVIESFKNNKEIDIYTMLPSDRGFAWYNFFWVKGSYINQYCIAPKPTNHRYFWETWIGHPSSKKEKIITFSPILKFEQLPHGQRLNDLMNQGINLIN